MQKDSIEKSNESKVVSEFAIFAKKGAKSGPQMIFSLSFLLTSLLCIVDELAEGGCFRNS